MMNPSGKNMSTNLTEKHYLTSHPEVKILVTNKVLSHNTNNDEKNAFVIIILLIINSNKQF